MWGFAKKRKIDLSHLEETLLAADISVEATADLLRNDGEVARIKEKMVALLEGAPKKEPVVQKPEVHLFAGVNGTGKTTTLVKMAHHFRRQGRKALLVGADTFRAAAGEQLQKWAVRAGLPAVTGREGEDPSAVVYSALKRAKVEGLDGVFIDTAGRLHTRTHLMDQLGKMRRIIQDKQFLAITHAWLVLDATTGQNGLNQARAFGAVFDLHGVILAKYDSTSGGGIVFSIVREAGLPVCFLGVGEGMDDLVPFSARKFVDRIFQ